MTIPKTVTAALRDPTGGVDTSIPLDDYLAARREDRGVTQRLGVIHLLELLEDAADRLDALRTPIIPVPTAARTIGQCEAAVVLDGTGGVSRCLRLEHSPEDAHENGALRWVEAPNGVIDSWWQDAPWQEVRLGDLLRDHGVALTIPHLPADEAVRITDGPPALEAAPDAQEDP